MTLDIRDLTVAYGDAPVLSAVSFRAASGELLGLLGPNGSGKTTVLQAITGMVDVESGEITLDGEPVRNLSQDALARRIGYLQQVGGEGGRATVFDTVLLGRNPHFGWRPTEADHRAVERVLAELGIEDLAMRELATLSGGQRRTVLLARALVQAESALLLDEPTSGLDLKHRYEVMTQIAEAVDRADLVGVVAIHDLALASQFCDRFVLLADGAVHATGTADVLSAETISAVYDVPVEIIEQGDRKHVVPRRPGDDADADAADSIPEPEPDPVSLDAIV